MSKTATVTATGAATVAAPSANGAGLDPFGRVWTLTDDNRQRIIANWNRAYLAHPNRLALSDERQAALQAAIEAGWILSPAVSYEDVTTPDGKTRRRHLFDGVEVDDLTAAEVGYYGTLCNAHFEDATRIPKASSLP